MTLLTELKDIILSREEILKITKEIGFAKDRKVMNNLQNLRKVAVEEDMFIEDDE